MQVDLDAYFNHQREVEYYCYNQQFHRRPAQVDFSLCRLFSSSHICRRMVSYVHAVYREFRIEARRVGGCTSMVSMTCRRARAMWCWIT